MIRRIGAPTCVCVALTASNIACCDAFLPSHSRTRVARFLDKTPTEKAGVSTTTHNRSKKCSSRRVRPKSSALYGWFGSKKDADSEKGKSSSSESDIVDLSLFSADGLGSTASSLEIFKASQEVGKRTAQLANDLSSTTVEGQYGQIRVSMDLQQRPTEVKISENLLDMEAGITAEELGDAVTKALQEAHAKSLEQMEEKMQGLYSDLGLPPSKS